MGRKIFQFSKWLHFICIGAVLPLCVSCNVFAPFNTTTTTQDLIEIAEQCEVNNDYTCAVDNYLQLPDGYLKNQKLCAGYMAKAGLTLSAILNSVVSNPTNPYLLGVLATDFIPWNTTKASDAQSAVTYCTNNAGTGASSSDILLQTISFILDCTMRMARANSWVAISEVDPCDSVSGSNSGTLSALDISKANTGIIGPGSPGMCPVDVEACLSDILAIQSGQLGVSSLASIQSAYNSLPVALRSTCSDGNTLCNELLRFSIRQTVACPNGESSC
jgi:hypothetical protein